MASCREPGIRLAIVESGREIFVGFVDAGRAEQVGRGNNETAVRGAVVVVEDAAELVAQGCFAFRNFSASSVGARPFALRGRFVGEIDPRRVGAWFALRACSVGFALRAIARPMLPPSARRASSACRMMLERFPVTFLQDGRVRSAAAALRAVAMRDRRLSLSAATARPQRRTPSSKARVPRHAKRVLRFRSASL